ncbi:MAG: hypothetical protein D3923_11480, partial [Candidatus Electrothrix sp. AR3]|nr:hypothetical protein [Candidatus Electrothrix sp. AR3]
MHEINYLIWENYENNILDREWMPVSGLRYFTALSPVSSCQNLMRLTHFNKKVLFNVFFISFLIVGVIPCSIIAFKMLRDVEDQLTSSLNNEYHLIARQLTLHIDQVNTLTWKTGLDQLIRIISHNRDSADRDHLLDVFFRQSPDILAIVIHNDNVPFYLLQDKIIAQLSAYDAEKVGQLLTSSCDNPHRT